MLASEGSAKRCFNSLARKSGSCAWKTLKLWHTLAKPLLATVALVDYHTPARSIASDSPPALPSAKHGVIQFLDLRRS